MGFPVFPPAGGSSSGVSQLLAGTGISLSPVGGTGTVTVTATGAGGGITALTGDVTASGTGSVAATIAANAVTLAKLATQATATVLGNGSGSTAVPVALTLSGLSATSTVLQNNLTIGVSGGQTVIGGTASGNGLTLSSTSNATKGLINFGTGTATAYVDETQTVTTVSGPLFNVGTPDTTGSGCIAGFNVNKNTQAVVHVSNTNNSGAATQAGFLASVTIGGTPPLIFMGVLGSNFTTAGVQTAASTVLYSQGTQPMVIGHINSQDIIFAQGNPLLEKMRIVGGSVTIGTGLTTTSTDGDLYINSCAGTPTTAPTTRNGGNSIALRADRTNNKVYAYMGGAWVALN